MMKSNWKLLLLLVCFAACGGKSKYMVRANMPGPTTAAPGKAMVVFIRPSGYGYKVNATVLDGDGNFVGQVPAKGYVRHEVAPGKHRFLVWAENTAVLEGEFAAGKTYYVEVVIRMGMWSGRSHLLGVKQGSSNWDKVGDWMAKSKEWLVAENLRQKWEAKKRGDVPNQLQRADDMWAKYDEKQREERTIRPGDGR